MGGAAVVVVETDGGSLVRQRPSDPSKSRASLDGSA